MPRATKGASVAEANVSSDDSQPPTLGTGITEILRDIERLKQQRADARSDTLLRHREKLADIRVQLENDSHRYTDTYTGLVAKRYHRLIDAIENQKNCEDAIFEQLEAIEKDAEHLAMLIDGIYTARMKSAKES